MTGRERITAMMRGRETDRLPFMPITMMFAAGQIGAKYRDYATDFNVLVEAQLRTAEAFDFDYVSCISDPGREAADCGAKLQYFDDQPPAVDERNALLAEKASLAGLRLPDPESGKRMRDRIQAAALFREKVQKNRIIEGWVEGPCAEAADLRGINALMLDFYEDPGFVNDLCEFTLALGLQFAFAQVDAGADIIGIGDAAASLVGPTIYDEFIFPYEKRLVEGIQDTGAAVRLHICGNTTPFLESLGRLKCEIVDLDSMVSLKNARQAMPNGQVLLGNIDPVAVLRNGTPEQVRQALEQCRAQAGPRYIVGAGCEVPRDTPEENLRTMYEFARTHT